MTVKIDCLAQGITAEYSWSPNTGEVQTALVNSSGEKLNLTFTDLTNLINTLGRAHDNVIAFRSDQRALVSHPSHFGLVDSLELGGWVLPDADSNGFGIPVVRWDKHSDSWEVVLSGLVNDLGARMRISWNDTEAMRGLLPYLEGDALVSEAALVDAAVVSDRKKSHDRVNLLKEADTDLATAKVNIALVRRTLAAAGFQGNGYRYSRYVVGPVYVPATRAKRAPFLLLVYPRWGGNRFGRGGNNNASEEPRGRPLRSQVTQVMESIGYHHVTSVGTEQNPLKAEVFSPGDPEILQKYAEALSVYALSYTTLQSNWGTPI